MMASSIVAVSIGIMTCYWK